VPDAITPPPAIATDLSAEQRSAVALESIAESLKTIALALYDDEGWNVAQHLDRIVTRLTESNK
jgi:hypothetical protein